MSNIVERLHRGVNTNAPPDETDRLMAEAADEIERLRAAQWQPGDPRCDVCDNGIHKDWKYCPYCGSRNFPESSDEQKVDK